MSDINNFIPEVWSARMFLAFQKSLVYGAVANRDYEGEVSAFGDTVHINGVDAVTIAGYTKNSTTVTAQALQDNTRALLIDQANYFAFGVDDVDKAQQNPKVMDSVMQEAAYGLKDKADQYIAGLVTTSSGLLVTSLGTDLSPIEINSGNAIEYIQTMAEKMNDAAVPAEGRWLIIPPWLHTKLVLAEIKTLMNQAVANNGFIGSLLGFNMYVSQNVKKIGNNHKILAGVPQSITYADQLVNLEALRSTTAFQTIVRGLHIFGCKYVRPDSMAMLTAKSKAEA